MFLHEIRIIDLKRSKWDEKASKPERGQYTWTDKQYIGYKDKGIRPDKYFTWVRYNPQDGLKDVRDYQIKWGYSFVEYPVDPYYPEGLSPDVEGHYRYGDVVLMKCNLMDELLKRQREQKMSRDASMSRFQSFKDQSKAEGVSLRNEDEDAIAKMLQEYSK